MAWSRMVRSKSHGSLGFRDMKLFNQALLARQAWRLVQVPDSLCAQVMKAKYYPNGNLLDTAFPTTISPTWRAMVHGLELLKAGVIWRVGNGEAVHIWRDNWLPRESGLKIGRARRPCRLRRVAQLRTEFGTCWNARLIERVFMPHDGEAILKLKIHNQPKRMSWPGTMRRMASSPSEAPINWR